MNETTANLTGYRKVPRLSNLRMIAQWLILAVLIVGLTGCRTRVKEANALAKQASETGDALESYYANLSTRSAATMQLNKIGQLEYSTNMEPLYANHLKLNDLSPRLKAGDSPVYLAAVLKRAAAPADVFFKSKLSQGTLDQLEHYDGASTPPASLNALIVTDLNLHMDTNNESWYEALQTELKDVSLSEEAQGIIAPYTFLGAYTLLASPSSAAEPPIGHQRRITINRLILNSAYPKSIRLTDAELIAAQHIALQKRIAMAHQLKSIGDALQNLTGSEATDKVKEAAANLQAKIEEVNHHPLTIASSDPVIAKILAVPQLNLTPSTLGKRLGELLAQIEQEREFRKVLPKVDAFLQTLTTFFEAEQPACLSISSQYFAALGRNDLTALNDSTIAIVTADAKTFAPYGVTVEVHPQTGENGKRDARTQIEQIAYARITTARQETQDVAGQLRALHDAFQRFLKRNNVAPPTSQDTTNAVTAPMTPTM